MRTITLLSFLISFLVLGQTVYGQKTITGKVLDSKTHEPLPFVNLVANGKERGTSTDIDGKFELKNYKDITSISFSYVGYEPLNYRVSKSEDVVVELVRKSFDLKSIDVYPGENPAHRIIDLVYDNRNKNNPEKNGSFTYESYNKLIANAEIDSTLIKRELAEDSLNESFFNFLEFLTNQHLFLMESVTYRKFKPPNQSTEKVLATRVSGIENPQFALVATQLQDFTFYNEVFYLADKEYVNPISKNSTKKYLFVIEDTILSPPDTTFIISYRPKSGKHFDGLTGLLYINSNGYAIEKVLAEPTEYVKGVNINIQQNYELVDNRKWFPIQTHSELVFMASDTGGIEVQGKIMGYLENIILDPELKRNEFSHVILELDPMANNQPDSFWTNYRKNELTIKEMNTYTKIDSLGEAYNVDQKMYLLNALVSGKAPIKFIDIDLDKILKVNGYENLRLGLGIHTNEKISKYWNVGGYMGYGFGDKAWKYGGDLNIKPFVENDLAFQFSYINDVLETGGTEFYAKPKVKLNPSSYRALFINKMDSRERYQALVRFRAFRYMQPYVFVNSDFRKYNDGYSYQRLANSGNTELIKQHRLGEIGFGFRYAYNEKYTKMNNSPLSLGTKAPVLFFKFTKGINGGDLAGELDYTKLEARLLKVVAWRALGKSSISATGGMVEGETPRTILFNSPASFWKFALSVDQSFQTMRPNEFFSNQFTHLFLKHSFPSIYTGIKEVQPAIVLTGNFGIGVLTTSSTLSSPYLQDYSLGYQEAGIGIDNLWVNNYSGLGIGAFYRFGAYELDYPQDNWAFKITYSFTFNFNKTTNIE